MKALFFSLLTAMMLAHPALAQETPDESESGLALPRMVSLRSNLINARSGPGARYPIEWVYMQKGAPVEIVAEFELWRKIKDWQGSESWVHKSMLSGRRSIKRAMSMTSRTLLLRLSPKRRTKLSALLKSVRPTANSV